MVPVDVQGDRRGRRRNPSSPGPFNGVGDIVSACSDKPRKLSRSRASARRRTVDCGDPAPASASCAVLPPGAAQRSATALPSMSPNSRTGNAAAASCTHHWPSAKPGSIVTEPCSSVRTVPVGSVSPCIRVAHCMASDLTVRSSEGSCPARAPWRARWSRHNARSSAPSARAECRASGPWCPRRFASPSRAQRAARR